MSTTIAPRRSRPTTLGKPLVLCYHLVSPTWEHRLAISPKQLLRQVRVLARWWDVRVTFDDGFRSAATVFPQLRDLGVPIQLFICSGYADDGRPLTIPELDGDDQLELATMTWDEVRAHADDGVSIGAHTVSHPHLRTLGNEEVLRELRDSKEEIETVLGRSCTDFAYPYGDHDPRVRSAVRAAGFERAYALAHGTWNDPYELPRLDLYRVHNVPKTIKASLSV
jgi:peptidoglycan/xylan/chitin deacetylase (PgdA/CDA1 family)